MSQQEQTRRAAAYIRESTEEQGRGYSPDGQRQAISRYAADHGMTLIEEYIDFETGRQADKRPDFQRLIEHAMEHRFDVVLVFHTSRFARNTVEAKHYKKLLRTQLGIEVISAQSLRLPPPARHRPAHRPHARRVAEHPRATHHTRTPVRIGHR